MFKVADKEVSTKITIGLARKLQERNLIDMLDPKKYSDMILALGSPMARLDILWEIVKDQLEGNTKEWFESNLMDCTEAFKSLDESIANFTQSIGGELYSTRWDAAKEQVISLMKKEMGIIDQIIESDEVKDQMEALKAEALKEMKKR